MARSLGLPQTHNSLASASPVLVLEICHHHAWPHHLLLKMVKIKMYIVYILQRLKNFKLIYDVAVVYSYLGEKRNSEVTEV